MVAAVLAASLAAAACQSGAEPSAPAAVPAAAAPIAVRVLPALRATLRHELAAVGTVRPGREVEVASRSGGTLLQRAVEEGAPLTAGALVATLQVPELPAREAALRAERARAAAQAAQACRVARTDAGLLGQGALPAAQADASASQCASAREGERAVAARLAELRTTAAEQRVRAPAAGVLLRWLADPGEQVAPLRPLAIVGAGDAVVEVALTDAEVARGVGVGARARVRLDGGSPWQTTTVVEVAPQAQGPLRQVAVRLRWPPALAAQRPGSSLDVRIEIARRADASVVPAHALVAGADPTETALVVVQTAGVAAGDDACAAAVAAAAPPRARVVPARVALQAEGWAAVLPTLPPGACIVVAHGSGIADGAALYAVLAPPPPLPPAVELAAAATPAAWEVPR